MVLPCGHVCETVAANLHSALHGQGRPGFDRLFRPDRAEQMHGTRDGTMLDNDDQRRIPGI